MENMWHNAMKMTKRELKMAFTLESKSDVFEQMLPNMPSAAKNVTYLKFRKIFKHNYFCAAFYLLVHILCVSSL
jgi:hypothetical protein